MRYDVIIVGGGPGGLAAALTLGRARKRVLLCDSGPRRNAAAVHMHNFLSRDGTPPEELRRIAREQLTTYPSVEVRDARVESVSGARGSFRVELQSGSVEARRLLLCTGMIDEPLALEGFRELWGHAIFQCPYCHGWEVQDQRWAYLARPEDATHFLPFVLKLRGWTRDLVVFTNGGFEVSEETRARLQAAEVRLEMRSVARLVARDLRLDSVLLADGTALPCDVIFAHPPQRQVELVRTLGVSLDEQGYVQVDAMTAQTSVPGIYAAGDLTTRNQGAILAAAAATRTASMINVDLALDTDG